MRLVEVGAVVVTVQVPVVAVQQAYKSQVGEMAWSLAAPVGSAFGAAEGSRAAPVALTTLGSFEFGP